MLDFRFVEVLLLNHFEDQFLLLGRAFPLFMGRVAVLGTVEVLLITRPILLAGQKARTLKLAIDAPLQERVQPFAFGIDLRNVRKFGADGDAILMRRIARQPELFGIVGLKDECHKKSPFDG